MGSRIKINADDFVSEIEFDDDNICIWTDHDKTMWMQAQLMRREDVEYLCRVSGWGCHDVQSGGP